MVWKYLEILSSLLEEDERQSVLGDIQERGATIRSAIDVTGLVLLRQLQDWQFWFPWLMTMILPAFSIVYGTLSLTQIAWRLEYLDTHRATLVVCTLIGLPILAWTTGFSLGSIGKRRTVIVLPLLAIFFTILAAGEARKTTQLGPYGVASVVVCIIVVALIPSIAGFVRGFRGTAVNRALVLVCAALGILSAIVLVPVATPRELFTAVVFSLLTLWPAVYALRRAGTTTEVVDAE